MLRLLVLRGAPLIHLLCIFEAQFILLLFDLGKLSLQLPNLATLFVKLFLRLLLHRGLLQSRLPLGLHDLLVFFLQIFDEFLILLLQGVHLLILLLEDTNLLQKCIDI